MMKIINFLKRILDKLYSKAQGKREDRKENIGKNLWTDKFGNEFYITRQENEYKKITFTDDQSEFMFMEQVYSEDIIHKNTFVKTYYCSLMNNDMEEQHHAHASLQQDIYGRLILYFYNEESCWDTPDDKYSRLWIFIENEEEADNMAKMEKSVFWSSYTKKPFIIGDAGHDMTVCQPFKIEPVIDIHSKNPFPSNVLSNLYPSIFTLDGLQMKSMEGFLQSLKTPDKKLQKQIQVLHGRQAQSYSDLLKDVFEGKCLYWKGKTIDRFSDDYQQLLRRAYRAKYEQDALFRFALEATQGKPLTHSIGKQNPKETILTEKEFVALLYELRTDE